MNLKVYEKFEQICKERDAKGRVLGMGASRHQNKCLLNMEFLKDKDRVGINKETASSRDSFNGYDVIKMNANDMEFEDGTFETVLCNAMLEHDLCFWKSIREMKRVLKSGGLLIVGVPGYDRRGRCLRPHCEEDYFRFSEKFFKRFIFEGMEDVVVTKIMNPPRIIGYGSKK